MADMIEHSNFVVFKMKQEWEDEMVKEQDKRIKIGLKEQDERIKMGLTCKCRNCHKDVKKCSCIGLTEVSTYWGF